MPAAPEETIALPLKSIVSHLPQALQASILKHPSDAVRVRVPLKAVKEQLPRGSVKITFGELRKAAPPGVFSDSNGQDQTSVELPLQEILAQLKPAQLTRRTDQKKVDVPPEVLPLFGPKGEPLSPVPKPAISSLTATPAPASSVPQAVPTPVAPKAVEPAPTPSPLPPAAPVVTPAIAAATSMPSPAAKAPEPAAPVSLQPQPPSIPVAKPPEPALPKPAAPIPLPSTPVVPITPIASAAPSAAAPAPPAAPEKIPFKLPVEKPAAPPPSPPKPPAAPTLSTSALAQLVIAEAGVFAVKIESFIPSWPEPVQQEIKRLNLTSATMAFPVNDIEQAVKRGKVVFTWKQIRASLRPSPPGGASAQDEFQLDLPLSTIVPLFLAQRKQETARKRKIEIADNIPHLFARAPSAPAAGAAAPATAAEPAPTPAGPPAAPAAAETRPPAEPDFGQIFGQPDKKNWTPMEIVQKTSTLPGVAGAAIALQEGLQVASQLPSELSGETFAAFLPQMFGRMSQYTKEMNLGEPNQLNLVANNVPVHIFKVGKVYFTVLGRAGQPLPMSQLIAVATQIGRQSK